MISQLFILNFKGDSIFFKDFRSELATVVSDLFWHELMSSKQKCSPVFNIDGLNYFYIFTNDLYFVAVSRTNTSPGNVIEQLQALDKLIADFCGLCSEQVIKDNTVLVTEIIDECINFGHIQTTIPDDIKPFIKSDAIKTKSENEALSGTLSQIRALLPKNVSFTTAASSTSKSVKDSTISNNVFLDVYEKVSFTVGRSREIILCEVDGYVVIKSFLPGDIDLRLSFGQDVRTKESKGPLRFRTPPVLLDDATFHHIVDPVAFDHDQALCINPLPIGECTLMQYSLTQNVKPPLNLIASFKQINPHRAELMLKILPDFPTGIVCAKFVASIHMPDLVSQVVFQSQLDPENKPDKSQPPPTTEFQESTHTAQWSYPPFERDTEPSVLLKINTEEAITPLFRRQLGPVSLFFEIPGWAPSGLTLQFDSISDGSRNYNPNKWVRRITYSGSAVFRI